MLEDESNGSSEELEISKLGQITSPRIPSNTPDSATQSLLDDEQVQALTTLILMAIGLIGALLVFIGGAIQLHLPVDRSKLVSLDNSMLDRIISIEGLIVGMGIELAASAMILYGISKLPEKAAEMVQAMWVVFFIGLGLTIIPAFCNFGYIGDLLMSIGVEFFGAAIVFALFEYVTRTLNNARA